MNQEAEYCEPPQDSMNVDRSSNPFLSKVSPRDVMGSVTDLEGNDKMVQKRLENKRMEMTSALLLNSPTFNTLDNRFEQCGKDSCQQIPPRDDAVQNLFAKNTWPGLERNEEQKVVTTEQSDGPRIASPQNDDYMEQRHSPSELLTHPTNGGMLSQRDSFAEKSDRSKRVQPSQGQGINIMLPTTFNQQLTTLNSQLSSFNKDKKSPTKSSVPKLKSPKTMSKSSTPVKKGRRSPTPDDMCEKHSPLGNRSINVVSSDTFVDRKPSTASKNNRRTNRIKKEDGYKKMNKSPEKDTYRAPARETLPYHQPMIIQHPRNPSGIDGKQSAHMARRNRIPSIAQHIRFQTNFNRLNLKTREELVSKTNLFGQTTEQNERFDVSVDLSHNENQSGFSIAQTPDTTQQMISRRKNNKIDSSFLQQSEILRQKPDGFRRISIQTDAEFGGAGGRIESLIGNGLHPLSPNKDAIMETDKGVEEEQSPCDITDTNSYSLLPKRRKVQKQVKIQDSVLQSKHESSRLADILGATPSMAPSIKKALKDRANFYRRKLTFYENLDVLATSMTSQEIQAKLREAQPDLNSSQATSLRQQYNTLPAFNGSVLSGKADKDSEVALPSVKEVEREKFPILSESPIKKVPDLVNLDKPMQITDFRPKDMTVRRSRILQSIDMQHNFDKSELPKSLERERQKSENVRLQPKLATARTTRHSNNQSVFSRMMAARIKTTSREHSVPSTEDKSQTTIQPRSGSMFKRMPQDPSITDNFKQVWRRVSLNTPLDMINKGDEKSSKVTSLKKPPKPAAKTDRKTRNMKPTTITVFQKEAPVMLGTVRDINQFRASSLQPIKLPSKLGKDTGKLTTRKVKLSNKLTISPLNQELKGLGPTTPSKLGYMREPKLMNYSHREMIVPPKSRSPATTLDEDKPSFMNKQKANKLMLLQKAIKTLPQ